MRLSNLKTYKWVYWLIALLLSAALAAAFTCFRNNSSRVSGFKSADITDVATVIELSSESPIKNLQITFVFPSDFDVSQGQPTVVIRDGEYVLFERSYELQDNSYTIPRTFILDSAASTLSVEVNNASGAEITIDYNVPLHFNWFSFFAWMLCSFIILTLVLCVKDLFNIELTAVTVVVLVGIICSFYVPLFHTYDEASHYVRAYNNAINNIIYDLGEEENYPVGYYSYNSASCWVPGNYEDYSNLLSYHENYSINETASTVIDTQQVVYPAVAYYTSGLGIKTAQLLNLSIYQSLQLARFFNLLFYAVMALLAIRIAPKNKLWFAFFYMLPINIFMASSLSTDYFINALLPFAIAMIIKHKTTEERMTWPEYLILLVILCLIPCAKSTYAPVLLLLCVLGKDKLPKKMPSVANYALSIAGMFLIFGALYVYGNRFGIAQWNRENVDPTLQMQFMLHHPLDAIHAYFNSLIKGMTDNVIHKYFSFAYLGNSEVIGVTSIVGLLLLSITDKEKDVVMSIRDWVFIALSIVGSYSLSWLALYTTFTQVGSDMVEGFQARYCIPIALMIYFALMMSNNITLKFNSKKIPAVLMLVFTAYNLWVFISERISSFVTY